MERAVAGRVMGWQVVVPVKRLADAKTRLRGLPPVGRQSLALAFAADAVAAALGAAAVSRVLVVTDDDQVAATVTALGADVLAEGDAEGLNAAIRVGLAATRRHAPAGRVAVMTADLPAVTSAQLDAVLAAVGRHSLAVIADADGTGTVLLAEAPPEGDGAPLQLMEPMFGGDSFRRHRRAGHSAVAGDWPGLRRDVDTEADLAAADRLQLGPRTAATLASLGRAFREQRPQPDGGAPPASDAVNDRGVHRIDQVGVAGQHS